MDIPKQIDYWRNGAEEEIAVARDLLDKRRFRHGLFFAHLAVEKMLKAHVTRVTGQVPPRIHNLRRLAGLTGLPLPVPMLDQLDDLEVFQLEGRYPDLQAKEPDEGLALRMVTEAKEILNWLTARF
jgi:HEPN domain-containing protein